MAEETRAIPTPEEESKKAFELQARRDIQDIRDLRENAAFNRYFLRRLKQRRDETEQSYRHDPEYVVKKDEMGREYRAIVCSKEDREILRQKLDLLEELLGLLSTDEGSSRVSLDRMG